MRIRGIAGLVMSVAISACGTTVVTSSAPSAGSPSGGPTSGPADSQLAPTSEPTPRPTPTPVLMAPCPTESPLTVDDYLVADPACLAGEIVVRGWLADPPGMGWEGPVVEPQWLYYPPDIRNSALWSIVPAEPDHACPENDPACGWYFLHIAPGSTVELGRKPRWVLVTGHIDDPAAATCHYDLQPDDPDLPPTDLATLIETCRSEFVVTSITNAT